MIREGRMVRHGSGPLMKVIYIFNGMATCWWVDGRGRVRQRFAYTSELSPLSIAFGPKTIWPAANVPFIEEKPKPAKKVSRRARKSKRAKVRDNRLQRKIAMSIDAVLREISDWRTSKLWGAKAIAQFAGVNEDTVKGWAKRPDCPITKVAGRFFVTRGDLQRWMTKKPAA